MKRKTKEEMDRYHKRRCSPNTRRTMDRGTQQKRIEMSGS